MENHVLNDGAENILCENITKESISILFKQDIEGSSISTIFQTRVHGTCERRPTSSLTSGLLITQEECARVIMNFTRWVQQCLPTQWRTSQARTLGLFLIFLVHV